MFTLYCSNYKARVDMTLEERKTFLIIIGVTILGLACYEIYFYFKNKK